MISTPYLYFSERDRRYYDPWNGGRTVPVIEVARLDLVRVRVAVTKTIATQGNGGIDADGKPVTAQQVDLSEWTNHVLAAKTDANFNLDAAGALDFAIPGFESADSAWHAQANGLFTVAPMVLALSIASGRYNTELVLLKTGARRTLYPPRVPLEFEVLRDVYTGSESNAPSGVPGGQSGEWTIADADTTVDLTVTGATATTKLAVGMYASTGEPGDIGQITQIPLPGSVADTVRLSITVPPGIGNAWNGFWSLI